MPRGRIHVGQDGEIDAVRLDRALLERAHDLVVAAGQRQGDFLRHIGFVIAAGVLAMGSSGRSEARFGRKIQPAAIGGLCT